MATSTISNTCTDPSGVAVASVTVKATLVPALRAFRTGPATEVAAVVSTVSNGSGAWSLVLERNADITPAGTYYIVEEQIPAASGGPRFYEILVGASDQTLLAAQVTPIPTVQVSSFLTQAAADARYQALGSLGSGTPGQDSQTAGSAGASSSASRADHVHQDPSATPRGTIGYVETTTSQTAIGTSTTDLTSLTVTFTAVAGRRYKVTGQGLFINDATAGRLVMYVTVDGTLFRISDRTYAGGDARMAGGLRIVTGLTAASHTIKLQAGKVTGTGTFDLNLAADRPAFILIEDIGV
jgi:hypothetical protein